jgi:hypothetical protein
MAVTRSTGLIAAWMVVGASVAGPRSEAAPPPADCVRTTIGPVVANVPSVRIRPTFRLDGKPFPGGRAGSAVITLWASEPSPLFDGPQLSLGQTDQPLRSVRVVPGVYDVYYSWQHGSGIPRNKLTRILRRVSLLEDGELVVDVPMVRIAGFKRHNGKPFADDGSSARLSLRSADGRGEVPLGGIVPSPFVVRVIPGLYSVRYEWQAGRTIPRNARATVLRDLALEQDASSLVLNVPSVSQDFVFLGNGAPFPSSQFESGTMALTAEGGDEVPLGPTYQPPLPVRIVPGSYDARFRWVAGATIVPRNLDGFVRRLLVNGSLRVIDVPSVEVSGAFRLNGGVPPGSDIENARINLVVPDSPDRVELGQTRWAAFESRVIPGRYDVEYEHVAGAALPRNPRAILARGWDVTRVPNRTIDIPTGRFHGALLLNGAPFPASDFERGDIHAVPIARDASPLILTRTSYNAYDMLLLPGRYQLAYALVAGGVMVPRNTFTTFDRPQQVARGENPESPVIDMFAGDLAVTYEHQGVPMPMGGPDHYQVHLQRDLNHVPLLDSIWGTWDWRVMEGTFDLFYQYRGGPGLPKNAFMRFGCWELVREQAPAGSGGGVISR